MTYQEALDYIWHFVNFETKPPETREPYRLDRMWALMERLGNPHERLSVIHVAGTKGKGSTSAMLESVLRAAGHRTALYTSPHLHDPSERLRLDGEPISQAAFIDLVQRLRPHFEAFPGTTTFEALTVMGFVWFAEMEVDVVVLEVGLGGRLDATNLVTPLVSVITPLALEHTAVLGNTIEEIAGEKGGIIKDGVPVVVADQVPAALSVLRQIAAEREAPLTVAHHQWNSTEMSRSLEGQTFDLWHKEHAYSALSLPLLGKHQIANATLVVAALHALGEQGITWDEHALREGLSQVKWPARVEVLQQNPIVIADGAHTQGSAIALIETLRASIPQGWTKSTLILGFSRDKDITALLEIFDPLADHIILTRARHPRAANPVDLATHPALANHEFQIVPKVKDAMQVALQQATPSELIVATGSLFVAAEARMAL